MIASELKRRIIDISYEKKLSHLGSCLGSVEIIDEIFRVKAPGEKFILSNGHAALALYVVMEKYGLLTIPEDFMVHPDRLEMSEIDCSTGSLGQGLPIAVGMALADRSKNVYCLISDGECAEGSIWEALRIAGEVGLDNLKVYCVSNGYSAYGEIDQDKLEQRLKMFFPVYFRRVETDLPIAKGLEAHYKVMNQVEYERVMNRNDYCDVCGKEITREDYTEEEAYTCQPRGFLGEGWGGGVWRYSSIESPYTTDVERSFRCKDHREGWTMVIIDTNVERSKKWVEEMLIKEKKHET